MHFVLTNDDGYDAPGLAALFQAIGRDHRVTVVAPEREHSRCGHTATLASLIRVRTVRCEVLGDVFVVDGTPVDCVRLGISELVESPVDWVISGINHGANVSVVDIATSGTVAAAREAAFLGIKGLAVSQMYRQAMATDWSSATRLVRLLLPQLLSEPAPNVAYWSINLPALPPGEVPAGVSVVPASPDHIPMIYESNDAPLYDGRSYEYRGVYESRKASPGTDVEAVLSDRVAVTPLRLDSTDTDGLNASFRLDP